MNNYIEETYCSFDTSKIIKVIGFRGECHGYYTEKGELIKSFDIPSNAYIAPTIQVLHRWLREEFDINVKVFYTEEGYFCRMDNNVLPLKDCSYDEALEIGMCAICKSICQGIISKSIENFDFEDIPDDLPPLNDAPIETNLEFDKNGKPVLKIKQ